MFRKIRPILATKWLRIRNHFSKNKDITISNLEMLFEKYTEKKHACLTRENNLVIQEIRRRLQRMNKLTAQIMDLNNQLLSNDKTLHNTYFDGETIVIEMGGKEVMRHKF